MAILDQNLADTLCTIIACGFIKRETEKTTGKKTRFIYESEMKLTDVEKHRKLEEKLNLLLNEGRSGQAGEVKFEEQDSKSVQPFIMAKAGNASEEVLAGAANELLYQVRQVETKLNDLRETTQAYLPGAYIGGLSTVDKVIFCGPSDLYPYIPVYRENEGGSSAEDNPVVKSYEQAKTVSNILATYLSEAAPQKGASKVQWTVERIPEVQKSCGCGQIFSSVHGMTRSICNYLDSNKSKIFLELALGGDTCKVASCIPCSIFMSANGMPATATHLGRGDNWNFPWAMRALLKDLKWESASKSILPESREDILRNWCLEVNSCYEEGMALLAGKFEKIQAWEKKHITKKLIPGIFLEALTYESSFVDKMKGVLGF